MPLYLEESIRQETIRMKKGLMWILLLLVLGFAVTGAQASGEEYTYTVLADGTAEIAGYTGTEANLFIPGKSTA